jgi:hypothetical protein
MKAGAVIAPKCLQPCQRQCKYQKANHHCLNCGCIGRCRNKFDNKAALLCVIDDNLPGTDMYLILRDVLSITQGEKRSSPPNDDLDGLVVPTRLLEAPDDFRGGHIPDDSPAPSEDDDTFYPDKGDLPKASLMDADQKMDEVYGDHIHQNPGTHLTGGITNN